MDLMSLLAKLTLDKTEYDKGLEDAEQDAKDLVIPTPKIPKVDNQDFKDSLDETEETGNLWKEVMIGVWNGVKDAIVVTGITSAVMRVVGAMRQGIDTAIETGDAVKKGAANLGISTKAYQELEYVLGKSDLKMKDLNSAMSAFDKARAGTSTKQQAEALKALGIDAETAGEKFSSSGEMLEAVMKELAGYNESDKGSIITTLFGTNEKWDGYFDQSVEKISELKREANDLGVIMPDEAIENVAEFKDATDEINNRIESLKRSFGESVLPMLTDAAKLVAKIVAFFGGGDKSLAEMFAGDDKQLADQLSTIEGTGAAAQTLADKLLKMGDTSKMTKEQYAIWKGTAQELINLVPSLGEVIDTETGKITANSEEIAKNIQQWKELSKQKAIQAMKEKKFQEITDKNAKVIEANIEANKKAGEAEKARVEAYQAFSDEMESRGLGKLDMNGDVSQQISDVMGRLADMGDEGESDALALGAKLKAIGDANLESAKAAQEAANLQKQVDEGMKDYEAWCASLEALYGTAGSEAATATSDVNTLGETINGLPDNKIIHIGVDNGIVGYPKAIGGTIPYDNYPALLHRGERVLTATQVRRGEGGGSMDMTGLKDAVISAIRSGMDGVTVNSYLDGKKVTDNVNRRNMRDVKGRRFA